MTVGSKGKGYTDSGAGAGWECVGPTDGACGIRHRTEATARKHQRGDQRPVEVTAEDLSADLSEYVKGLTFPPLTAEQISRLAVLFRRPRQVSTMSTLGHGHHPEP